MGASRPPSRSPSASIRHLNRSFEHVSKDREALQAIDRVTDYLTAKRLNSIKRSGEMLPAELAELDAILWRNARPIGRGIFLYRAVDDFTITFGLRQGEMPVAGSWSSDGGWMSTSVSATAAQAHLDAMLSRSWPGSRPRNPATLTLFTQESTWAVWIGDAGRFPAQQELLLAPGARLRVVDSILNPDGPPTIVCEVS